MRRLFVVSLGVLSVGCGGTTAGPAAELARHSERCGGSSQEGVDMTPGPETTLCFDAVNVSLSRFPSICGVQNPPFEAQDEYGLNLDGEGSYPTGSTAISLTFHPTMPLNEELSVSLGSFGQVGSNYDALTGQTDVFLGQSGTVNDSPGGVTFEWQEGPNPGEVDSTPLTAVTLDFLEFPRADGEAIDVRITMTFQDGGILDFYAEPTLQTDVSACPAP